MSLRRAVGDCELGLRGNVVGMHVRLLSESEFPEFRNFQNSVHSLIRQILIQTIWALPLIEAAALSVHTPSGLMRRPVSTSIANAGLSEL